MRFLFFLLLFITAFTSCFNNAEIGNAKDVDPESIYYDYKVWADEDKDVTVMLQYRFGGAHGTTLVLDEPSKVSVDDNEIKADSAKLTGAYYEVVKPVDSFEGKHIIVFTDKNRKEHKEEFSFEPFTLAAEFPEKLKKEPFKIKLDNFPSTPTHVRLLLTDTSMHSLDVNEEMMIEHGEISVNNTHLSHLTKGPVILEVYREDERPVKNGSKEGGKIYVTYGIKRQFELVE